MKQMTIQKKIHKGKGLDVNLNDMLQNVPEKYRSKAENILSHIVKSKFVSWNKNNELVYKGRTISKSNIIKLLIHVLKKKTKDKPKGMKQFYKALSKLHMPNFLLVNKIGKSIIKKSGERNWRPPGGLGKK